MRFFGGRREESGEIAVAGMETASPFESPEKTFDVTNGLIYPADWTLGTHVCMPLDKCRELVSDCLNNIGLYMHPQQTGNKPIMGTTISSLLDYRYLVNAFCLNLLLVDQSLIPKEWEKAKRVFFLGTDFKTPLGKCVRGILYHGSGWIGIVEPLNQDWRKMGYIAMIVTRTRESKIPQ